MGRIVACVAEIPMRQSIGHLAGFLATRDVSQDAILCG